MYGGPHWYSVSAHVRATRRYAICSADVDFMDLHFSYPRVYCYACNVSSIRSYVLPRTSEGGRKLPRTVRVSYRLNGLPAILKYNGANIMRKRQT